MATKTLTFTDTATGSRASFVSEGTSVIQIKRKTRGNRITVYAGAEGMDECYVGEMRFPFDDRQIFCLEIMKGLTVTVVSDSFIEKATLTV